MALVHYMYYKNAWLAMDYPTDRVVCDDDALEETGGIRGDKKTYPRHCTPMHVCDLPLRIENRSAVGHAGVDWMVGWFVEA